MRLRSVIFSLSGLLFISSGIGRYLDGRSDVLAFLPVITGVFYLLAALYGLAFPARGT